jgi:hypothetical protein
MDICRQVDPVFKTIAPGRQVACHLYEHIEDMNAEAIAS